MTSYTVSYCQTRAGHCLPRRQTIIEASSFDEAVLVFMGRQRRKGRGFINTWVAGPDGVRIPVEQAKSWRDPRPFLR